MLKDGIETHRGKTNPHILLIAPHGHRQNDVNTGLLVRSVQRILDCPAIINEAFRKPKDKPVEHPSLRKRILDLNIRAHAEMHPTFINVIEKATKHPESTFVFWIHGIEDGNLLSESKSLGKKELVHCLIGCGQPDRFTCGKASRMSIPGALESAGVKAALTRDTAPDYKGHDTGRMNQWFKQSGNGLNRVQSIQLEFGFKGVRDTKSVDKTAQKLASALLSLNGTLKIVPVEKAPDKSLVADTLKRLSEFFNGDYHTAMEQAGDFIIERFYGREPERVIEKKPVLKESLFSLIKKLQKGKNKVPSKSWFYNARDLAGHEQIFKKRGFQIFGKLGHSHKLALLHVRDLDKIQTLAKEAIKNGYNVEALKNRIREEKGSSGLNLTTVPTKAELAKVERKVQLQLQKKAETKIEHHQKKLAHFQKCLEQINGVLEKSQPVDGKNDKLPVYAKPAKDHPQKEAKRASGFQEWAGKTFSICTGCENDCIYCWAKERAYRFRQVAPDKWKEPILRQHDVDRKHRFYGVRVAFPSTHDILPSNIDAYLVVLRKLLDTGNEVLIVSKPRLDCIRAICDAAKDFKEKILFRFTIGAIDDDILSFWEPNAPKFVERAESLQYAFRNGFRTSVSTEPMLQSSAIEAMAHKLLPHVNDAMWIGKMNYLGRLKKHADKVLASRIVEIEQGQTDERIWAIYNRHKDNPKIKWKDSIKKVVGLKAPSKPGMDI